MRSSGAPFLKDFWYLAAPAAALKPGRTLARRLLGEPVLLGRSAEGAVFALRDLCPHRAMPLRHGTFDGRELACAYHGWRFRPDGGCAAIPSLTPDQAFDLSRIRVRSYPCHEHLGGLWVHMAEDQAGTAEPPALPTLPNLPAAASQVSLSALFPCDLDHAAFGLMDPTHAAFVHTSWWWKKDARRLRLKEKAFEPVPFGWRMVRHRLPPENRIYRLLGREVTTEITYRLPGLRIEHIEGERHAALALTALTPLDGETTEVHQTLLCTLPWLGPFKPLLRRLARTFLDQDRAMVVKQREGLAQGDQGAPSLLLIDDADTQAKWFQRLKREWLAAKAEGRDFRNPLKAQTLRWRS
jgi:phenylpropionate dioxygenase-like ring-hydroxylating dioxygenase large terminal subunit